MSGDGQPPLDSTVLKTFVGDDKAFEAQLLRKFVSTTEETIADIHEAVKTGSAEDVSFLAHKQRSSSSVVGATAMAGVCTQLEQAAMAIDWAKMDATAQELERLYREIAKYVEQR